MDEENSFGLTQAPTREISFKIIFTVQVSTDGRTAEYIKESGQIIKWKEKVFSLGVMAAATSEAIKMIRNTETVHSNGPTVASISVNGFWENSTVKEYISKKEKKDKVFGRWEKE
jgi:hypothetical protein